MRSHGKIASSLQCLLPCAIAAALLAAPGPRIDAPAGERAEVATVLSTDDAGIKDMGLLRYGTQRLRVRLADGREADAYNELRAQLDLDKTFAPGDKALVAIRGEDGEEPSVVAKDHWRLGACAAIFGAFGVFLVAFGGKTGFVAIITFFTSCLAIWKILIPTALAGCNVQWAAFLTVAALTAAITVPVAGSAKTAACAFGGAMLGSAASLALARAIAAAMHVDGATMPFAQQLYYAGPQGMDLRDIFAGAGVLAASGAVMDLAMDISSALEEVSRHNPSLGFAELFASGRRVGKAVLGTMTTTLLLAYSGGCLAMLMSFAAAGANPRIFLNSTLVGAEAAKTLAGSFGLALTAPFTALAGAYAFRARRATT